MPSVPSLPRGFERVPPIAFVLATAATAGACACAIPDDAAPIAASQTVNASVHRDGLELVYDYLDRGDLASADLILTDQWPVERYDAVRLPTDLTWREDPYREMYWQYIFYGLQPTRHLLWAFATTGAPKYRAKLLAVLQSFHARGLDSPFVSDKHGSAWRGLVLTNTYWKLKRLSGLSSTEDAMLTDLIVANGTFLANPNNFEGDYNHGIAESMSLLMIAVNFPELPQAGAWRSTASTRLEQILTNSVAADGVVYEQAYYYHFYELVQFWAIAEWLERFGIDAAPSIAPTISRMIRFATHIAMPNGMVPMFGASLPRSARTSEAPTMSAIAERDSTFRYVFTAGAAGTPPPERCVLFPISGPAIMRSGWDRAEFASETHVVMDVGPYRTSHSDLDALSVHLHADGKTLVTDPGLFTYEPGVEHTYFSSTAAHNTVTVDGKDQQPGAPVMGLANAGAAHCYQSGYHDLYSGVRHRRGTVLIAKDLVLVLDHLTSDAAHAYDQTWRTPPELRFVPEVDGASIVDAKARKLLAIKQAYGGFTTSIRRGSTTPFDGWYSKAYEDKMTPADVLRFGVSGAEGRFATLLASGSYASSTDVSLRATGNDSLWQVFVTTSAASYAVTIGDFAGAAESISVTNVSTGAREAAR